MGKFIVVDCEANGPVPGLGDLTEFGAVYFHDTTKRFHGVLTPIWKDKQKPGARNPKIVMQEFAKWIYSVVGNERPIFISDNPSYDFMWIAYYFHHFYGSNPFGWSGRRIGDFYAGLTNNLYNTQKWKRLRITKHIHDGVSDALGNAEALERILRGER